jgi:hypothetical protein
MPRSAARLPRKTKSGSIREAFDLLGIHEADVCIVPQITPLLKKANVLERVWDYLETSGDETARILIAQKYKLKTKTQRNLVPFEAYCVSAKLDTKKVLGLIFAEVYSQNEQAAGLMAAEAQPSIVQATINAAIQPGGSRERDMMHKHSNFVPVPKTSITVVHGGKNVIGGGQQTNQSLAVLPPIEKTVRDISDRFNERLLSAAPPAQDESIIDHEDEEDDEDVID